MIGFLVGDVFSLKFDCCFSNDGSGIGLFLL